ncbi:MAG: hypothetical protein AAB897_04260 [Patescibacteria group bacterium]
MFKIVLQYKIISTLFVLSFILVLGGALWAYFILSGSAAPLILHFNGLIGITQIGGAGRLLGVGIVGAIGVALNFVLAIELERREKIMGKLLAAGTLFLAFLLFLGFASIISVN